MPRLKILFIMEGFGRIVYKVNNDKKEEVYYCLQDEGELGVKFYRCSNDSLNEGRYEPSYIVKPNAAIEMELPIGETELEENIRKFIIENDLIGGFNDQKHTSL